MGVPSVQNISAFRAFRTEFARCICQFPKSYPDHLDVLLSWGTTRFTSVPVNIAPAERIQIIALQHAGAGGHADPDWIQHHAFAACQLDRFCDDTLRVGRVYLCACYLFYSWAVCRAFPFLASIIALFSGAQLFALGIFGEYLARMFDRSMDRPTLCHSRDGGRVKVVILQPSYIPWRGYFDQIRRADLFIFYDDVQYDKHGWRNRNQIKTPQGKQWLTIPVHSRGRRPQNIPINGCRIDWANPWNETHLKPSSIPITKPLTSNGTCPCSKPSINAAMNSWRISRSSSRLLWRASSGITHTRFMRSSEIAGITGQKTDRLIQILQPVGATHYISGPSAQ